MSGWRNWTPPPLRRTPSSCSRAWVLSRRCWLKPQRCAVTLQCLPAHLLACGGPEGQLPQASALACFVSVADMHRQSAVSRQRSILVPFVSLSASG